MKSPIWEPSEERKRDANMTSFISLVNERYGKNFNSYDELYDWSIQSLMSKDIPLANRVLDAKLELDFDDLWGILMKETVLMPEISTPILSHVPRIIDNLKQTYVYALEIAEIAIDRAEELS